MTKLWYCDATRRSDAERTGTLACHNYKVHLKKLSFTVAICCLIVCKACNFVSQHCIGLCVCYYVNGFIFFILQINEFRSMLWSFMDHLDFICWKVSSKNKNEYFPFQNIYFLHGLSFVKIVPISNTYILRKGAHLNFAMSTILHRYACDSECCFPNCTKPCWIKLLSYVLGGDIPPLDQPLD